MVKMRAFRQSRESLICITINTEQQGIILIVSLIIKSFVGFSFDSKKIAYITHNKSTILIHLNMEKDEQPPIELERPKEEIPQKQQTFKRIIEHLTGRGVNFEVLQHSATRTSQQSASQRNTPLEWGSKTMIVAGKTGLALLLYRADRKISWAKLRKIAEFKKSRMTSEEEVKALGVLPGAVPPFAKLLGINGVVDSRFKEVPRMAFNAGLRGRSIVMATTDFPFEQMTEADITE